MLKKSIMNWAIVFIIIFAIGIFLTMRSKNRNIHKTYENNDKEIFRDSILSQNRLFLKKLAFCHCVNSIYNEFDSLFNDGSESLYFENIENQYEDVLIINALVLDYINKHKQKSTVTGATYGLVQCFNLYDSDTLSHTILNLDTAIYHSIDMMWKERDD